jgi:hypothetical protein
VPDLPRSFVPRLRAGLGCQASAGTNFFERSCASEIKLQTLRTSHPHLRNADRVQTTHDHKMIEETFDAITAFHVLEHLQKMSDIIG